MRCFFVLDTLQTCANADAQSLAPSSIPQYPTCFSACNLVCLEDVSWSSGGAKGASCLPASAAQRFTAGEEQHESGTVWCWSATLSVLSDRSAAPDKSLLQACKQEMFFSLES